MHFFYTPDIVPNKAEYTLSEEESKHCTRVLRLKEGDEVSLIDGKGHLYKGLLQEAHPKRARIKILSILPEFGKRNHYLHIAIAPTKNIDRLEWFLEKATEIGIDEISLLICEHSERREVKTERLQKVITAAVKQSLTAYHPKLNEATKLNEFLKRTDLGQGFIAHCLDQEKEYLTDVVVPNSNVCILIGPEGDFSLNEVDLSLAQGFRPISLGNTRLRTETAALYACFEINVLNRN
ncbi:16S rRNA (uracil(1498)-N(3))-methyltransferase [Olivibacter domesticus]|uniref:Ribosomal RNA small subunit methyltransferase E n=1 Tax=Olivibacter domesticus TaxID=407022 RepID=A0A1H7VJK6_OLID1|nr:16S rRNA (uracil(1498)-N(3))-methyltransferase [Olivibacter domesticus]SEM09214.1 16S rRNA (uracil1498-N3)-methyltransferase [Olivibacter domesticus]